MPMDEAIGVLRRALGAVRSGRATDVLVVLNGSTDPDRHFRVLKD